MCHGIKMHGRLVDPEGGARLSRRCRVAFDESVAADHYFSCRRDGGILEADRLQGGDRERREVRVALSRMFDDPHAGRRMDRHDRPLLDGGRIQRRREDAIGLP